MIAKIFIWTVSVKNCFNLVLHFSPKRLAPYFLHLPPESKLISQRLGWVAASILLLRRFAPRWENCPRNHTVVTLQLTHTCFSPRQFSFIGKHYVGSPINHKIIASKNRKKFAIQTWEQQSLTTQCNQPIFYYSDILHQKASSFWPASYESYDINTLPLHITTPLILAHTPLTICPRIKSVSCPKYEWHLEHPVLSNITSPNVGIASAY